jgi:hypothetical protein
MGENTWSHMMHFEILSSPLLGMSGFMFCASFVDSISPIIMATSDIVLIVYGICTLKKHSHYWPNLTCANLALQVTSSREVVLTIVAQAKIISYRNRHHEDDFILLAIEKFGCLHINRRVTLFINVPTWHGQRRALEVLFLLLYIHFIGRGCQWLSKEFKLPISCIKQLWQLERFFLGLVSFQVFCPSFCTTCFMLVVMGSGARFLIFYS